jgi:hypothetical protein
MTSRIDRAFFLIRRNSLTKLVDNVRQNLRAKSRCGITLETADAQFCSSDRFAVGNFEIDSGHSFSFDGRDNVDESLLDYAFGDFADWPSRFLGSRNFFAF